jgi:predicted RNase H-like nuclease (RuvC/YqgF family)
MKDEVKMKRVLFGGICFCLLASGCQTMQTPQQRRQVQAREQAIAKNMEERIRRLESRVESSRSENVELAQEVQQLRADMYAVNQKLGQLGASVQSLDERQAREIKGVASTVMKSLESIERQQKQSASRSSSGTRGPGREHTVEPGHTLSAIASAYGSTVSKIKQANNLRSDTIQVGQKLFIPE